MQRAAIYARISQADPRVEAIADQERRCRELADREGYAVVAVFSDDGISAFTGRTRPGWLALNDGVRSGAFDVVLAVAEDRLARDAADKIGFQVECAKHAVTWHTIGGGKVDPSTAGGALMSTLTAGIAQYESQIKRERVQASVDRRIRDGIDLNGPRPFGFESDRLTIREAEAAWVRWGVQAILDGGSVYGVRKRFNEEGVLTSTGRPWLTTTVRQLLLRPRNAGLLVHRGDVVNDSLPPLVAREDWEAMRSILEHPDRKPKRGPKVAHVGSGVVVCSVCGSAMRFHAPTRGRAPRYICTRENQPVRDRLVHPTMLEADLELALAEAVFEGLTTAEHRSTEAGEASLLRAERAELARVRGVQQQLAEMPGADLAAIAKRLRELGRDIEALDARLSETVAADARETLLHEARLAVAQNDFGFIDSAEAFARWLPRWEALPVDKRQPIIRDLLGVVTLSFRDLHFAKGDVRVARAAA